MNAKDVRDIWQKEVNKETNFFISYIKGEILKQTFQEGIWLFAFNYNFKNARHYSAELISEVLENTQEYFANLGFITKKSTTGILLTYSDKLQNTDFTRNLMLVLKNKSPDNKSPKWEVYQEILTLIKDTALKGRSIEYKILVNKPNEKCLSLTDVQDIINNLTAKGFAAELEGLYPGRKDSLNPDKPSFPEQKKLILHISW